MTNVNITPSLHEIIKLFHAMVTKVIENVNKTMKTKTHILNVYKKPKLHNT